MPLHELKALPLKGCVHPQGLVALWVTNNRKLHSFIQVRAILDLPLHRAGTM